MNAQHTTVVIQLNDEQWEDVREILAGALGRLEQQAREVIHQLRNEGSEALRRAESRSLALSAGGEVLVTRQEAGHILGVGEDAIDKARQSGGLPAARFRGRFALSSVVAFAAANDNKPEDED